MDATSWYPRPRSASAACARQRRADPPARESARDEGPGQVRHGGDVTPGSHGMNSAPRLIRNPLSCVNVQRVNRAVADEPRARAVGRDDARLLDQAAEAVASRRLDQGRGRGDPLGMRRE